uniref:Uncharacterized protein n=1 Tax=Meloidogyne enterolobii TaxID=390850 RepID=A0A6V7VEV3_MELEN|nr:unnamed protein product [Meloidogyne enterolobii]
MSRKFFNFLGHFQLFEFDTWNSKLLGLWIISKHLICLHIRHIFRFFALDLKMTKIF